MDIGTNALISDMEIIKKLVKKEISVKDLSEEDGLRLIKLCEKENENLNKRIDKKEKYIELLENQIKQYKKNDNQ